MPVQFDQYNTEKIKLLKNHLVLAAAKHTAKFYEIFVDHLQAVPKTDDPEEFGGYEDYLSPGTNFIKIVIYCTGLSPRNDQYFFSFKAQNQQEAFDQGLDGFALKTYSQSELTDIKSAKHLKTVEQEEIKTLKKQITDLDKVLQEKQEHIDRCERGLQIAKENGNKIGGIHAGDVLTRTISGLIRNHSKAIEKVTGVEGLAGIIENNNADSPTPEPSAPDSEVSFKSKDADSDAITLTEQEKKFLSLCNVLQTHFSEPEMTTVMSILDTLSKDKTQIQPVLELLQD